jgi:hypothetical protein
VASHMVRSCCLSGLILSVRAFSKFVFAIAERFVKKLSSPSRRHGAANGDAILKLSHRCKNCKATGMPLCRAPHHRRSQNYTSDRYAVPDRHSANLAFWLVPTDAGHSTGRNGDHPDVRGLNAANLQTKTSSRNCRTRKWRLRRDLRTS